jgi:hypothetical protein
MLGIPDAGKAEPVAEPRQIDDVAQGVGGAGAVGHRREVEDRERQGHARLYRHLTIEGQ